MTKAKRIILILLFVLPCILLGCVGGFFRLLHRTWKVSVFYYQTGKFREYE